eukprot:sb/3476847/
MGIYIWTRFIKHVLLIVYNTKYHSKLISFSQKIIPRPYISKCFVRHSDSHYIVGIQEPTETSKQSIRTLYLGHVTGDQPIRDHYFLIRSVPVGLHASYPGSQEAPGEDPVVPL